MELFACSGYTIAATQSTSQVFAILDHTTFHNARSVSHLSAEKTFTKSSGAEVQKATMVKPITSGEIPYLVARLLAQLTSISAHLIKIINPNTKYR